VHDVAGVGRIDPLGDLPQHAHAFRKKAPQERGDGGMGDLRNDRSFNRPAGSLINPNDTALIGSYNNRVNRPVHLASLEKSVNRVREHVEPLSTIFSPCETDVHALLRTMACFEH